MYIAREYKQIDIRTSFVAWACKVLDNRVLTYIRNKKTRQDRIRPLAEGAEPTGVLDGDVELKVTLRDCLKKISTDNPRYARILNLHYQGYSTDEVCRKLNMTPNHSYVTLSRARSMLAACLEKGGVDL
jgi:RNA polymerase sigma factor (sigma-70 family)